MNSLAYNTDFTQVVIARLVAGDGGTDLAKNSNSTKIVGQDD
jgi:hypothetical protein